MTEVIQRTKRRVRVLPMIWLKNLVHLCWCYLLRGVPRVPLVTFPLERRGKRRSSHSHGENDYHVIAPNVPTKSFFTYLLSTSLSRYLILYSNSALNFVKVSAVAVHLDKLFHPCSIPLLKKSPIFVRRSLPLVSSFRFSQFFIWESQGPLDAFPLDAWLYWPSQSDPPKPSKSHWGRTQASKSLFIALLLWIFCCAHSNSLHLHQTVFVSLEEWESRPITIFHMGTNKSIIKMNENICLLLGQHQPHPRKFILGFLCSLFEIICN